MSAISFRSIVNRPRKGACEFCELIQAIKERYSWPNQREWWLRFDEFGGFHLCKRLSLDLSCQSVDKENWNVALSASVYFTSTNHFSMRSRLLFVILAHAWACQRFFVFGATVLTLLRGCKPTLKLMFIAIWVLHLLTKHDTNVQAFGCVLTTSTRAIPEQNLPHECDTTTTTIYLSYVTNIKTLSYIKVFSRFVSHSHQDDWRH